MKNILFIFIFVGVAHANGPVFQQRDPMKATYVQQEFDNVYQDMSKKLDASVGGYIVQSSQTLTTFSTSTTSSSFVKSNLKVTITPKYSTSKIKVSATGSARTSNAANDTCIITIKQNTTDLASPMLYMDINVDDGFITGSLLEQFKIPPIYGTASITTTPTVYEVYMRTSASAATCTLCENGCQLLVEEIK